MFCSDPMSGSHFIVQTSKFLLINATAVTLGQGHGKVIQYISPEPYILCANYLRFSSNSFDARGKSCCGGASGRGGNELKTVTPDWGDLINIRFLNLFLPAAVSPSLWRRPIFSNSWTQIRISSRLSCWCVRINRISWRSRFSALKRVTRQWG